MGKIFYALITWMLVFQVTAVAQKQPADTARRRTAVKEVYLPVKNNAFRKPAAAKDLQATAARRITGRTPASQTVMQRVSLQPLLPQALRNGHAPVLPKLFIYKQKSTLRPAENPQQNFTTATCDTIFLTRQSQIDSFAFLYPGCTSVKLLHIDGAGASPAITSLAALGGITSVSSNLIVENTSVTTLAQLTALTHLDTLQLSHNALLANTGLNNLDTLGSIIFRDLPALTSIAGLSNNITSMGKVFMDSTSLATLAGLNNITVLNDYLELRHSQITNLSGISNLTRVSYIWLEANPALTSVDLNNLAHMDGLVLWDDTSLTTLGSIGLHLTDTDIGSVFFYNTKLADLSGMDNVTGIINTFIGSNSMLTSLHGLENITAINYGVSVWYNPLLNDLTGLSALATIDNGKLEISGNSSMTTVNGMANLIDIGGGLWIRDNQALTALDGFNNNLVIHSYLENDQDSVYISYNYNLSLCSFAPLCNFFSGSNEAIIENNGPGCSTIGEIIAFCGTCDPSDQRVWNGDNGTDWADASNWTPNEVPGTCTVVTIPQNLSNYPEVQTDINIGGLIMESNAQMTFVNNNSITIKSKLHLDGAYIYNAHNINAVRVFEPYVTDNYIEGNFSCTDYGGESKFQFNYFYGNTLLSDSVGRSESSAAFLNTFSGDLTLINNSDYGQNYLGNASPGNDLIEGNLTVINHSNADISVGLGGGIPVKAAGNVTINANTGNININNFGFTGGNNVHFTQAGSLPIAINHLYVDKAGWQVVLDQETHIKQNLELSYFSGYIVSAQDKMLVLDNNCTLNADAYSGAVWGPMKRIGNSAFTFPLGDLRNNTIWSAALTITPAAGYDPNQYPPNEYTAAYIHKNPNDDGYDTSHYTPGFGNISSKEYWMLTRSAGSSDVQVTLRYDQYRSDPLYDVNNLQVAGWNGSLWKSWSNGGFTGSIAAGSLISATPLTEYGPITFAYKPVRKPIITIGEVDTSLCRDHYFRVPFSLDSASIVNNVYRVEVSDSLGNFSTFFNPTLGSKATTTSDTIQAYLSAYLVAGKHYKIRVVGNLPPDTSVNVKLVIPKTVPQLAFTIIGPDSLCANNPQQYYPSVHDSSATAYVYTVSGGTFTQNSDTAFVTWTAQGNRYITVYAQNDCGSGYYTYKDIFVRPPFPVVTPVITNTGRWLYTAAAPASQTIQWYRGGTAIAGATSTSYYAALAGAYTARYINTCGAGPVSNAISFAAASVPQTISFAALPNKTYGDAPFSIPVSASSGLPVTLTVTGGPGYLTGNIFTITGTGIVTIAATQAGDNNYDTAAAVTRTFTVNKATQTISFTAVPEQTLGGSPVTLAAVTSSGLAVTYTIVSGPAYLYGNVLYYTGVGNVTIAASQAGDDNYLPATTVNNTFCVSVASLDHISGAPNVCPGQTVTYSTNNIAGLTYNWRLTNGTSYASTSNTAAVTWGVAGTYTLLVSATGPCGAASKNDTLVVNVLNTVSPAAVTNMLPADGSVNLALPLTLSWIPGSNTLNYDVYIWDSATVQPSVPFAADITALSFSIPANALVYNKAYKWRVVAKNACLQTPGVIQYFRLMPLPDLAVSNVQAPTTAFSGQQVSINWTVTNNGPGKTTTNQSWTDAVFLSYDTNPNFVIPPNVNPALWSIIDLPLRPLLIGTKPNVSALDSGQHYNNSINFTLPVSYSQPVYIYVITNYPAGANAPLQMTVLNDTAHAPQPIAITLSPTPDLRVDTVFTPASTFSGSTVNVTYKVKNYGVLTPAGSNWTDKIYISQSPFFSINNSILLKLVKTNGTYYPNAADAALFNTTQLKADSSYTRSVEAVVPNFISGTYYIYVVTNADNTVYEGALANNNTGRNLIQVFLTPTPDLTVSTLTVPVTAAGVTQPIGINWNIFNAGFNDNIERNKGHFIVPAGTCYISYPCNAPPGTTCVPSPPIAATTYRDSLGFGSSYWTDRVYLSTDPATLNVNTARLVKEVYHGVQYSGLYAPENIAATECRITGSAIGSSNISNVINPQSNFPVAADFSIPDDLPEGNYYLYVYPNPDKTVFEYPDVARTRRSALPILIQRPDLSVPAVTVPATAVGGQAIAIGYTIHNSGSAVYNHLRNDKIYMSSVATFNASAQEILSPGFTEDIPAGGDVQHSVNYVLPPGTSGTRYFFVRANFDSAYKETTYVNNTSAAASSVISAAAAADLTVASVQTTDPVSTVFTAMVKYKVNNTGAATNTAAWTDSVFISCSNTFNPATAYYIGSKIHTGALSAGGNYTDSVYVNMRYAYLINSCFPAGNSTGYFYVKTNADNNAYEGANTNNNVGSSGSKTITNPYVDHIVTTVNGADTATVARPYQTSWTVKNIGLNPGTEYYYGWVDGVYLSPDSVLNANAIFAQHFDENTRLNNNQTYSDSKPMIVPNVPTGDYYLIVNTNYTNSIIGEKVLSNNTNVLRDAAGAAKKIHVVQPLLPDLTDTILSVPNMMAVGQPVTVKYKTTNSGPGATYPSAWGDNVWLSADLIPGNANDILLSAKNHSGTLAPGVSVTDSITTTLAINTVPGNYILIAQVNASNNVFETNAANNLAFSYVTVYRPAPSDLIVQDVMKPDTVYLGYTIDTAKWIVKNISSNNAAGYTSDGVYLSKTNVLDSTAMLLGIKSKNISMAPLSSDTITMMPLVNNVVEGNYNLIVKTDVLNNIVESNKDNNTGLSATPVYVKVKELPLNVVTPNTLSTVNRYYKLVVPDSLRGATILVTLKSQDSLTVKNQLFIGLGYIPSAAHFDYSYDTPNYGNQQIVLTSVVDSVYYISIRCVSTNPPVQNITLKAEKLPFAILNVNASSGGNTGNVTVKLSGSLFTNNMTAKLTKPGTTINAAAVYFVNSTSAYATFNLQGKPLGVYDVTLMKPDTTEATLAASFSVVPANNGGLITGGGVNTGPSGSGNEPGCDPGAASGLNSQLVTQMVIQDKVFGGWVFVIQINYNNPTNVDIPAQTKVLYSVNGLPLALSPQDLGNAPSTLHLELTEQNGPPGIIRAGGSGTIIIYSKAPVDYPAHTYANFRLQ